jgi:hypothetical protein
MLVFKPASQPAWAAAVVWFLRLRALQQTESNPPGRDRHDSWHWDVAVARSPSMSAVRVSEGINSLVRLKSPITNAMSQFHENRTSSSK